MAGYVLPTTTSYVSDSWQGHINRNPPSTEPGTDYGSASGSPLFAPYNGRVYEVKTTSSGAMGRYIAIDFDDGRRARALHLKQTWVSVGQRVSRGQQIGLTGASAYGSDYGVGSHVHQTLWPDQRYVFGCCPPGTIDFAKYVGSSPEPPDPPDEEDEEDDMAMRGAYYTRASDKAVVYLLFSESSGWWAEHTGVPGAYNNAIAASWQTNSFVSVTESHAKVIKSTLDAIKPKSSITITDGDATAMITDKDLAGLPRAAG